MLKVCKKITNDNIVMMVTDRWISMEVLNYDSDDATHFPVQKKINS